MKVKNGQRCTYKDSSYHFLMEVFDASIKRGAVIIKSIKTLRNGYEAGNKYLTPDYNIDCWYKILPGQEKEE